MNILLVLRTVILDIFIMTFLLFYSRYCSKFHAQKSKFTNFALTTLAYSVFGAITEITVNSSTVPSFVNDLCHMIYFSLALLFSLAYFDYVMSLLMPAKRRRKYDIIAVVICAVFIIIMAFSKIEYVEGNGTCYSKGVGPSLCYMLGFVSFVVLDILMIVYRKKIKGSILFSILPISIIGIILLVVQIIVPEFLFSESVCTLISIGAFFSIENPIGKLKSRAFMDLDTGTYNKNCYDGDLAEYKRKYESQDAKGKIACVMFDINNLKYVNDNFGHLEGDKIIRATANIIMSQLKSASKVYRVGGDEFIAFYEGNSIEQIESEIKNIPETCKNTDEPLDIPLQVAVGYAIIEPGEKIKDLVQRADKNMYANKNAIKGLN